MVAIDIAQAGPLQAAIQKKLVEHGYSPEDDMVMAEYVTVMLANSKTSEQITTELSDLIGPEYESSFTEWIFEHAIPENYGSAAAAGGEARAGDASAPPAGPSAASASAPPGDSARSPNHSQSPAGQTSSIQTVGDSRESSGRGHNNRHNHSLPSRPPTGPRGGNQSNRGGSGSGVFGTAMQGLKREGDRDGHERPSRRPRTSEPGFEGSQQQQASGRSIFDRAGVTPGTAQPNNFQNMGGRPFQNGPRRGGGPGFPQTGGPGAPGGMNGFGGAGPGRAPVLPPLHIPDNFNSLPPAQQQAIQQQIFQHQLIAAAAAQQMFGGGPPPHMNAGAPPFAMPQPGVAAPPSAHFPGPAQQGGPQSKPSTPKPAVLPKVPTSEELCKYGVDCKNAICGYSHPSPAATKDSGLVLSKDVCEKNLNCTDKDCPKSHVSPAQKTDPKGLNVAQYAQKAKSNPKAAPPVPSPAVAPAAPSAQIQPLNPGAKPCMFGSACTRPGCFFSHPPTPANSGSTNLTPCRFGIACTRPDCHFSHPPGHRRPGAGPASKGFNNSSSNAKNGQNQRNVSATFSGSAASNGNGPAGKEGGIEGKDDVKIDDSKMSARMKKFMDPEKEGEKERILPGSGLDQDKQQQEQEGDAKRDSLEVVM